MRKWRITDLGLNCELFQVRAETYKLDNDSHNDQKVSMLQPPLHRLMSCVDVSVCVGQQVLQELLIFSCSGHSPLFDERTPPPPTPATPVPIALGKFKHCTLIFNNISTDLKIIYSILEGYP